MGDAGVGAGDLWEAQEVPSCHEEAVMRSCAKRRGSALKNQVEDLIRLGALCLSMGAGGF